jgi:NurA-like 5'-3' nuclease
MVKTYDFLMVTGKFVNEAKELTKEIKQMEKSETAENDLPFDVWHEGETYAYLLGQRDALNDVVKDLEKVFHGKKLVEVGI